MTLRDNWNNVVNSFRNTGMTIWQRDTIETSRTNKCDITLFVHHWFPPVPLITRFSGTFLHNVPKNCAREIKSTFNRHNSITLDNIITILVNHNCKPRLRRGNERCGFTHSTTDFYECSWHLYVSS